MVRSIFRRALRQPGWFEVLWSDGTRTFSWGLLEGEGQVCVGKGREAAIVCAFGSCGVESELGSTELGARDLLYVAGPTEVQLAGQGCLLVAAEAPSRLSGLWMVKRAGDAQPILVGGEGYRRFVYTLLGVNDPGTSLLAGFTEGFPGEWTSFPPHKHDDKVEVYVYYGLGDGFGVQIVEDEGGADSYIVRDGDAVVILRGYHPNVASPGSRICYVWVLCQTLGEKNMRVEVKPGFERFQVGGHLQVKRP
ncbi:MAG: 5-deoxy-glucuronate isomerase [Thermofilaceae archaeon]